MIDHPIAIFADQIRPGMRCESTSIHPRYAGVFTVTQVRDIGVDATAILGTRDDGSPYIHDAALKASAWLCHDSGVSTPETADTP